MELIGKKVVFTKTDGWKKYGILLSFDASFIKVRYADGNTEFVPLSTIAGISEATR